MYFSKCSIPSQSVKSIPPVSVSRYTEWFRIFYPQQITIRVWPSQFKNSSYTFYESSTSEGWFEKPPLRGSLIVSHHQNELTTVSVLKRNIQNEALHPYMHRNLSQSHWCRAILTIYIFPQHTQTKCQSNRSSQRVQRKANTSVVKMYHRNAEDSKSSVKVRSSFFPLEVAANL